jgi:hypothetical protein
MGIKPFARNWLFASTTTANFAATPGWLRLAGFLTKEMQMQKYPMCVYKDGNAVAIPADYKVVSDESEQDAARLDGYFAHDEPAPKKTATLTKPVK